MYSRQSLNRNCCSQGAREKKCQLCGACRLKSQMCFLFLKLEISGINPKSGHRNSELVDFFTGLSIWLVSIFFYINNAADRIDVFTLRREHDRFFPRLTIMLEIVNIQQPDLLIRITQLCTYFPLWTCMAFSSPHLSPPTSHHVLP